jgi:TatD DNase family protein
MIDTHSHVYEEEMPNYKEIIEECKNKDISMIINGVDNKSNKEIVDLANEYDNVYPAIGLNYDQIDYFDDKDLEDLEELIKSNNVVALGEIGLDYYWTKENSEKQVYFFKKQLELAKKYDLPVIVHSRKASQEVFDIIKESGVRKGSMHCYSGSVEMAKEFIKLGFKIGIDGPITYSNNVKGIELVKEIPLEYLLLETDSPYLAPEPNRGLQNSPLNLIYIAEKIAEIKGISADEVIEKATKNAKELFNL